LRMGLDAGLREALLGAGMNGKNHRDLSSDRVNGAEKFRKLFCGIDVRRAVQRKDGEPRPSGAIFQTKIVANGRLLGDRQEMAERIDHDVADEVDGFAGATFIEEMLNGVFLGDEEIVGEGVGEDAIDFFRHSSIEAAEAGFDVGDLYAELYGGQRDGNGGVDIAND